MGNMKNELKSMFTEHWKYLAVNAACELELFDRVFEGQNSLNKLVKSNSWDSKNLSSLLEFLLLNGYLNKIQEDELALTEKSNMLRKNNTEGLYHACLNWSGEHLIAWQNLNYTVATGKSSFEHIYNKQYFEYLSSEPQKLISYHKAMFEYAIDDYKELPNIVDFSRHSSIMDVGGGFGAAISIIHKNNINVSCVLFDLAEVVSHAPNLSVEKIGGDFFQEIPKCSEAIILSRVLHDWDNDKSNVILSNCKRALPMNGTLYVIENCADKVQTNLSLLSLNMAAMCQSFERSSTEYISLCENCGFTFKESRQLNHLQTILIFQI